MDIALGFRMAYHFNWTVPNLDTYANTTIGVMIPTYDIDFVDFFLGNMILGVTVGARYFFGDTVGVFLETGYNGFADVTTGLALHF
jgi:hypothetical protein